MEAQVISSSWKESDFSSALLLCDMKTHGTDYFKGEKGSQFLILLWEIWSDLVTSSPPSSIPFHGLTDL